MKAITVRQPWAWAIVDGHKDVENRTRNIAGKYRGPLLIHAGAAWDKTAFDHPVLARLLAKHLGVTANNYVGSSLPTRCFVGLVTLESVHWPTAGSCSPWAMPDHFHLVLGEGREFHGDERVPARGALGLWTPPAEVLAQLPFGGGS